MIDVHLYGKREFGFAKLDLGYDNVCPMDGVHFE